MPGPAKPDCVARACLLGWEEMANYTATDLVEMGSLPPSALEACAKCAVERRNVLVTGIAGSGKTTLLRALAGLLPKVEPVLVLDDGEGLDLAGPSRERVSLSRGDTADSPRQAVARSIRAGPRRLVIGNVCPPEAGEILRALVSGRHDGSLLATSAGSAEKALRQLATWSLGDGFSWDQACRGISAGIHLVVGVAREPDGFHRVAEVAHVAPAGDGWKLRPA